ncbi:MAG: hypothetical protein GY774_10655 [Planctomycetes bacterium]|nr:hypothetical protein [Planctomycetota bacterium]
MTKIIEWRQKILSELPINEDLFVEKFLMEGIQELCRRTQCYTEDIAGTSTAATATHTLTPVTTYVSLVRFLYGKYKLKTLPNKTVGEMTHLNREWESLAGTPPYIVYEGGNTIRWGKIPDSTGDAVEFTVALEPTDIVNSDIPELIEIDHLETIKDYVKWKYYMQPGPFLNVQLAKEHKKEYEKGRGQLKISVITGFSGNSQVEQAAFMPYQY